MEEERWRGGEEGGGYRVGSPFNSQDYPMANLERENKVENEEEEDEDEENVVVVEEENKWWENGNWRQREEVEEEAVIE